MPTHRILRVFTVVCLLLTLAPAAIQAQPSHYRAIQQADAETPTVPGFGNQEGDTPVLGFGEDAEERAILTSEDLRNADERLRRYDRNHDGLIDRRESREGRWHDDPFVWDKNGDDRLSRTELGLRYAKRRILEAAGVSTDPRSTSNRPDDRERQEQERREREQQARQEAERRRAQYEANRGSWSLAESLMRRHDTNRDGHLDALERRSMGMSSAAADVDRNGEIRRDELARWLAAEEAKSSTRGPIQLPEWFAERDRDQDGQVTMAEFADQWTDEKLDEFAALDSNEDGIIVPDECLASVLRLNSKHSNQTLQVIPSKGTVRSRIEVDETKRIVDLDVQLSITHTYDEHLNVYLIGPEGEGVELFTGVGGHDDNFDNTILDDEAPGQIVRARPPFKGTFQPEGVTKGRPGLKQFYGRSMAGTWTLLIEARSDRPGALHSWSLLFKTTEEPPADDSESQLDEPPSKDDREWD